MAIVALSASPATLDSGGSEFVTVTNTGAVDVTVSRGPQSFTLRPNQSRTVYPEGSAVTAVASGSGQVTTLAQAAQVTQSQQVAANTAAVAVNAAAIAALPNTYASGALVPLPQRQPKMTPIATYQTGHGWSTSGSGIASSNLNDTSDYVIGSQCSTMTTDGTQGNWWFQKMGNTAVDMTTNDMLLWLKVDNAQNFRTLKVFATSDAMVNYYSGTVYDYTYGQPPAGTIRDNEWFPLRFNLSDIATAAGSPVKTAITGWRFNPSDLTGKPVTIKFGGLMAYPRNTTYPNGVVTFGFDDSFISHRTLAAPYLAKYGWAGTAYTICDAINGSGIPGGSGYGMTVAQLRELRDIYGWELAAHAYTVTNHGISYADLPAATLQAEIVAMVNWLQNNGVLTSSHFAYPRGRHNATAEQILSRYFSTARTLQSLPLEQVQPGVPRRSRALQVATGANAGTQAAIDKAYTNGNWLQLCYHDIVTSGATGNQTNLSELQTIVDYCATKGIAVASCADVWRASA